MSFFPHDLDDIAWTEKNKNAHNKATKWISTTRKGPGFSPLLPLVLFLMRSYQFRIHITKFLAAIMKKKIYIKKRQSWIVCYSIGWTHRFYAIIIGVVVIIIIIKWLATFFFCRLCAAMRRALQLKKIERKRAKNQGKRRKSSRAWLLEWVYYNAKGTTQFNNSCE